MLTCDAGRICDRLQVEQEAASNRMGHADLVDLDQDGMHEVEVRGMCGAGPNCEGDVYRIDHLLQSDACSGPYNACAPEAVRNNDFTQKLAHTLHRPAVLPAPAWFLRLALGEMSVLLLGGQRLVPRRTQETGFTWRYPQLSVALAHLLQKP